jgi:hypothetical protein
MSRGRPRTSTRLFADDCTTLSASNLQREWGLWPTLASFTATWPNGTSRNFRIAISTTRTPTGGERPWFVCPVCLHRCGRLYLLHEQQPDFACRVCLQLVYECQYRFKGPEDWWFRDIRKLCLAKIHLSRRRLIFINEADTLSA